MIHIIKLLLKIKLKSRFTLIKLFLIYSLLIVISSFFVSLVEPESTALKSFGQAVWWSIVTSTTVGYRDIYPVSVAGKILAVLLPMFMGIGVAAAFLTYFAGIIFERRDKSMHGEIAYKGKNHILIVGTTDETSDIIEQILRNEQRKQGDIVLLTELQRHPLPGKTGVYFVKGKPNKSHFKGFHLEALIESR